MLRYVVEIQTKLRIITDWYLDRAWPRCDFASAPFSAQRCSHLSRASLEILKSIEEDTHAREGRCDVDDAGDFRDLQSSRRCEQILQRIADAHNQRRIAERRDFHPRQ